MSLNPVEPKRDRDFWVAYMAVSDQATSPHDLVHTLSQHYLKYHTQHTVCGDGRISSNGPEDSGDGHDARPRGPVNNLHLMDIVTQPLDYDISTNSPYEVVIRRIRAQDGENGIQIAEDICNKMHETLKQICGFISIAVPSSSPEGTAWVDFALVHRIRNSLRRVLVRFCKDADCAPRSLFLEDVVTPDSSALAFACGSFADLFHAEHKGRAVVLKRFRVIESDDLSKLPKFFAMESVLWSHLRHPNVLPFLGLVANVYEHRRMICMVSPFMKNGDMEKHMIHLRTQGHAIPAMTWIHDVASGLRYLHDEHLVHADLRPSNILIDDDGSALISDFGLTRLAELSRSGHLCTTYSSHPYRWAAPELALLPGRPSYAADVWAFGCVCYEIMTGEIPYSHFQADLSILKEHLNGGLPGLPSSMKNGGSQLQRREKEALSEMVLSCWNRVPDNRPKMTELYDIIAKLTVLNADVGARSYM